MELRKQRIGNTVLFKTGKLQEQIGVGRLYLKMEGLNPTGHMHDRIAYYLAKEAVQLGFKTIVVASLGQLGESLAFISGRFGLNCKVVMPAGSIDRKKTWYHAPNTEIIERGSTYREAYNCSRDMAKANNWYDANHAYSNCCITDSVYAEIAEEIATKLGGDLQNVFCFLSNGALITGLHLGFRTLWRRGVIQRIPRIFVACANEDNPLLSAFTSGQKRLPEQKVFNRYKGVSKNTIEYNVIDPQNVLNAIYDSGGSIISVSAAEISQMTATVRLSEHLKVFFRGAASLAACASAADKNLVSAEDTTVVILEEGRNDLRIRQLDEGEFDNLEELAVHVDQYLGKYGDDRQSVLEALKVAFLNGFVLGAFISGKLRGLAVVIRMPVKTVLPEYHLVYIGADIASGSRGIGTRLMEEVRKITEGNFSLHVDVENKKAIRLYEKMGLKKCYFRMIAVK
ncbi:MAG: pyridoxal-phosphate dependent enzyme [Candidatus Riflebacteria bacterium]|nr:pyridoxal-phosphate dependent enzyme [Candidatus Riflebacteria bacterium]